MSGRFLLDTDWVVHYLHGNPEVRERLDNARSSGVALSMVSLGELYEGVFSSSDPEASERGLMEFLRGVEIIELDDATCRAFGRERGRIRKLKKSVGDFDLLMGATALRHDLTLLSNNRKHFEKIEGLRVESTSG